MICNGCGEEFDLKPHQKRNENNYCTNRCRENYYKKTRQPISDTKEQHWAKRWCQYKKRSIDRNLSFTEKEEFIKFIIKKELVCEYCGIPQEKIKEVYPSIRIKILTIDRKDVLKGYTIDNMCLACMPCNSTKSTYLSFEEMKEIGQKYFRIKWDK